MPHTSTPSFVPDASVPTARRLPPGPAPGWPPDVPPGAEGDPPDNLRDGRPRPFDGRADDRWTLLRGALSDRLPSALRGGTVDPAVRGALVLTAVAVLAAIVAVWFGWHGRAVPVAVSPPPASIAGAGAARARPVVSSAPTVSDPVATSTVAPAQVVVDVAGKVRRPGVFHLAQGARVVDALTSAGGPLPGVDTTALSLARKVVDGEQILVTGVPASTAAPVAGGVPAAGGATDGAGGATDSGAAGADAGGADGPTPSSPLDLNTATAEQLDGLPGVGPVLAQRIVQYREQHGGFTSVDQIRDVQGVGDKKAADILPLVRVS